MKKTIIVLLALVCCESTFSQIYQDNDNKGILFTFGDSYTLNVANDDIIISSDGSAGSYEPFGMGIINLTDQFAVYAINYAGQFVDQYSPNCIAQPTTTCPVNDMAIDILVCFVKDAVGGYNGTLDIDWISFGESLEAPIQGSAFELRYNQLGYTVNQVKLVSIVSLDGMFSNKPYTVFDSSNSIVLTSTTGNASYWSDADEYAFSIDVSSLNIEGSYTFEIDEDIISFEISADPYYFGS